MTSESNFSDFLSMGPFYFVLQNEMPFIVGSSPVTEETPLLQFPQDEDEIYGRFSPAKKKTILALVSLTGLLPSMLEKYRSV